MDYEIPEIHEFNNSARSSQTKRWYLACLIPLSSTTHEIEAGKVEALQELFKALYDFRKHSEDSIALEKKKVRQEGLRTLYLEDNNEKYLTRYGLAEQTGYSSDYISDLLKSVKTSGSNLNLFLLDWETDQNGTKGYRLNRDKLARSVITGIESFFFTLSEEEKAFIRGHIFDFVRKSNLFEKVDGETQFSLVADFFKEFLAFRYHPDYRRDHSDREDTHLQKTYESLLEKIERNILRSISTI